MQSNKHDEYIDYSCSTSVERLARDIETQLREWHVDKGSDRHVSVNHSHALAAANALAHDSTSEGSSISSAILSAQAQHDEDQHRVAIIRSNTIDWSISFYLQSGSRISSQVQLKLTLWDAPRSGDPSFRSSYKGEKKGPDTELPFSIQRGEVKGIDLPLDTLENFSKTFGIGQHITLTPIDPDAISDELRFHLYKSVLARHDKDRVSIRMVGAVLTNWLQSSLNVAASFCQCSFPLIGVWAHYNPSRAWSTIDSKVRPVIRTTPVETVFPLWIYGIGAGEQRQRSNPSSGPSRRRRGRSTPHQNSNLMTPVVAGQVRTNGCRSTFWCGALESDKKLVDSVGWTSWGSFLLRHCRHLEDGSSDSVNLWGARYIYSWRKSSSPQPSRLFGDGTRDGKTWRSPYKTVLPREPIEVYRHGCRMTALDLLERFSGSSEDDPSWGPRDDPIASMHAIVTWNSPNSVMPRQVLMPTEMQERVPLVMLPLKSRVTLTEEDKREMEKSIENSILDPSRPSVFQLKSFYDTMTTEASLAATQRCVLAALIRTSTLPRETLLSHLVDETVIENWDAEAGNHIANTLATRASVDEATHALVVAMDWRHAIEGMIHPDVAEECVDGVLDGRLSLEYPNPPSRLLSELQTDDWLALLKSAPPGRLLSLLFVRMANVHSAPSMALVWKIFVDELRQRWDRRESLPNMHFVPGLDPPYDASYVKRCFSSVGKKAQFASFANCTEPDPDDVHCLVGQKLQVFNICVESIISQEMKEIDDLDMDEEGEDGLDPMASQPNVSVDSSILDTLPEKKSANSGRDGDDATLKSQGTFRSQSTKGSQVTRLSMFFDAEEGNEWIMNNDMKIEMEARKGARCPVVGSALSKTGDQVYAPYLLRAPPLTDDIVAQRRLMMARQKSAKASSTIKYRIEVAQRLQYPKLLSDMQCFKAANPGAEFEDFVGWYGNPENPLEGFEQKDYSNGNLGSAASASMGIKLDKAAEAIRVLDDTRKFWSATWEEAKPIPATDQNPLFDATNCVEMAIDYLETIHPASLLCQVMAVNLAMSYYTLVVHAGESVTVRAVRSALVRFREHVVSALSLLSHDTTYGDRANAEYTGSMSVVSIESLAACGRACMALSEAEVQVSRARSLLNKLPQQLRLVEKIMAKPPGSQIEITDKKVQSLILASIARQIKGCRSSANDATEPSIREYILMNDNDRQPCQLSVKYQAKDGEAFDVVAAMTLTRLD